MGPCALSGAEPVSDNDGMSQVSVINRTVNKTHEWLERLCDESAIEDPDHAYGVLRAVLHALRDRIGPDVAVHLAAQLPLLLRGTFYEGWDPRITPERLSLQEFVVRVEQEASLGSSAAAISAVRAVMQLLYEELAPGTMDHVIAVLPSEYAVVL